MTVQELIQGYRKHNPDGHYFDRAALQFFGEKVDEMEIIPLGEHDEIMDNYGVIHKIVCLKAIAHNAPAGETAHYTYFDAETFEEIDPKWRTML